MVKKLVVVLAESTNVFVNQGIEKSLFDSVDDDTYILYLWTNDNTVVIGRNQNAQLEVNIPLLEKEGGKLARRLSGGGAVFHDKGNLNFTFIAKSENFSLDLNRKIILDALTSLGFDAKLTGRNDIEINGCKVSGNAYYKKNGTEFHHGTMLITSLKEKVARYLTPPSEKFSSKSVKSVTSRVASLNEFKEVSKEDFKNSMINSFKKVFNLSVDVIESSKIVSSSTSFFLNDDWRYGTSHLFAYKAYYEEGSDRYYIYFDLDGKEVSDCEVYTDSLNEKAADNLKRKIIKENIFEKDDKVFEILREKVNV